MAAKPEPKIDLSQIDTLFTANYGAATTPNSGGSSYVGRRAFDSALTLSGNVSFAGITANGPHRPAAGGTSSRLDFV